MPIKSDRILLFQKVVPSYRVPIFKALYERFGIVTCHSIERKNASWKSFVKDMEYPNVLLRRYYYEQRDTSVIQSILPVLIKYRPRIIISEFALKYATFWLLLFLRPLFRYKLIAWTHGIKNKDLLTPFNSKSSKIALWCYNHIDGVLLYSYSRRDMLKKRVKNPSKLFVAKNTLDLSENIENYNRFREIGISKIKEELQFKERYNLVFIGRVLKQKRIDLLLSSFALIQPKLNVALHIIGGGEEEKQIRDYQNSLDSIHHYGPIYDESIIGKHLFACDIMVMPGYIGLAIVHSFSYGTPIITCKRSVEEGGPLHSPEIEYLEHGKNGLFCESSSESIAESISMLLTNHQLLSSMSKNAYQTAIGECSLENMMKGFEESIEYLN